MYPLKFEPILKSMVWGGERIPSFKSITTDRHNIGESWEISGVKDNESVVSNGEFAGRTITDLVREYKDKLIGKGNWERTGEEFPLLVKFIDAKQDLSIQVHPDDELAARKHNGSKGKTEMWYVVDTAPGAHLMSGLKKEITPEEYVERVNSNTITDVLEDFSLQPGDVFFLPAGRIHSIGAGSFIAEIQQTSDITYRISDFGRLGLDGKPRQLHTELAKEAIDYKVYPDYKTSYEKHKNCENVLVDCRYFTTSLYDLDREHVIDMKDLDSFLIIICIDGKGTLTDSEGNSVPVHKGETVLIPASSASVTAVPDGTMQFLTSYVR